MDSWKSAASRHYRVLKLSMVFVFGLFLFLIGINIDNVWIDLNRPRCWQIWERCPDDIWDKPQLPQPEPNREQELLRERELPSQNGPAWSPPPRVGCTSWLNCGISIVN